jgi:hypothetical protein
MIFSNMLCLQQLLHAQSWVASENGRTEVKVIEVITDSIQTRHVNPDSALIRLVKLFEGEKFKIVTRDGHKYSGRVSVRDNGIEIGTYKMKGSFRIEKKQLIEWVDVERLQLEPHGSALPKILLGCGAVAVYFLLMAQR